MKTLSKIILLSLLSFFCLAQVSIAEECKDDPEQCTPKKLCDISTEILNGQKYWINSLEFEEHVKFAKEIGIDCGASDPKSPCELDANECKISELCEKATITEGGDVSWNIEAEAYLNLAKEYGLNCNVQQLSSSENTGRGFVPSDVQVVQRSKLICRTGSLQSCDNKQVCDLATYFSNFKKKWSNNLKIRKEAERRGLDCGISKEAVQNNTPSEAYKAALTCDIIPSKCNEVMLCYKATWFVSGAKRWKTDNDNIHVVEAKFRGLNCGVSELNEVNSETDVVAKKVIIENTKKKVCPYRGEGDVSPCSDELICMRATVNKEWDNSPQYKSFVREAKKRGLDCGVTYEKTINFEASFKSQTIVRRKQIQFALKELGHYRMGIDGLWGNGTRKALMSFASDEFSGYKSPSSIFSELLNKVSVPSTFASVKKPRSSSSNTNGWAPLSGNPKLPFDDAKDICEAKAQAEGMSHYRANQPRNSSNNFNCYSSGSTFGFSSYSCSQGSSGGFWGGVAQGLQNSQAREAARDLAKAVAKACMAEYGWFKQ